MEEQTLKVLEECSSGCKMAIESMHQIREYVKNEKLAGVIEDASQKHCKLEERASRELLRHGQCGKAPGKAAETFSWLTTEIKMMIRDDSRQIAKIMMNGCNMGIQSMMAVINDNPEADRESLDIARDIVKAEEDFMEELKPFL